MESESKPTLKSLPKLIKLAWLLRLKRDGEFKALVQALGRFYDETQSIEPGQRVQILNLQACLARLQGSLDFSESLNRQSEEICQAAHLDTTFELHFQRALNFYSRNNFMAAYEDFFSAQLKASSDRDRFIADFNILFCLDNLGYDVEPQFLALKARAVTESIEDLKGQIEAFDLRLKFRKGDIACPLPKEMGTQEEYLRIWLNQLPYNKNSTALLPGWLKPHLEFYKRRDRLGTIFQIVEGESEFEDLADRLYLWVWRWICRGDGRTLKGVLQLVIKINSAIGKTNFTFEDMHLISNALKWLKLFMPQTSESESFLKNIISPLDTSHDYDIFHFESAVIDFIDFKRKGLKRESQNILGELKNSRLWRESSNLLPDLVRSIENKDPHALKGSMLLGLFQNISLMTTKSENIAPELLINLEQNTAFNSVKNEKILSAPVVLAFKLLFESESVSFEEISRYCFRVSEYDEYLIQPRIFNLISRMKRVLPADLSLKTKSQRLYASGSWDKVFIAKINPLTDQLRTLFPWQELSIRKDHLGSFGQPYRRGSTILKKLGDKKQFSRRELENLLGASKSTAYRTIKSLLAKGQIKVDGSARRVKYTIVSPELLK
jgi:hypothetical protein